jgi:hypothetical protein
MQCFCCSVKGSKAFCIPSLQARQKNIARAVEKMQIMPWLSSCDFSLSMQ